MDSFKLNRIFTFCKIQRYLIICFFYIKYDRVLVLLILYMTNNLILNLLSSVLLFTQVVSLSAATISTESNIDPKSLFMNVWWDESMNESVNNDSSEMSMNQDSWMDTWTTQQIDSDNESDADLESAPEETNYIYSSWEIMHRTPMIAGFTWTGEIANFITPAMYIGTPLENNEIYSEDTDPFESFVSENPTTYAECLSHETYLSFGLEEIMEDSHIKELKAIAKACAKEYYGSYFSGKSYTTREEFLMMMFTLFEEDQVGFQWEFTDDGEYIPSSNDESVTSYSNVDSKAWYASYLKLADDLVILPLDETTWKVGKEITDNEAIDLLSLYTAYRMSFEGDSFDTGVIITEKFKYNFSFINEDEIIIKIQ